MSGVTESVGALFQVWVLSIPLSSQLASYGPALRASFDARRLCSPEGGHCCVWEGEAAPACEWLPTGTLEYLRVF